MAKAKRKRSICLRFTYALNDVKEPEDDEELLTMEGIPTAFPPLKPPPTSPSKSAALRAITVHFYIGPRYSVKVFGFTCSYSDGVEVSVGETRDTIKARLDLEEGEHIVSVIPMPPCGKSTGRTAGSDFDYLHLEGGLSVGSGNALRSIEWDNGGLRIKQLKFIAMLVCIWSQRYTSLFFSLKVERLKRIVT